MRNTYSCICRFECSCHCFIWKLFHSFAVDYFNSVSSRKPISSALQSREIVTNAPIMFHLFCLFSSLCSEVGLNVEMDNLFTGCIS
jgi:hypothetical protein